MEKMKTFYPYTNESIEEIDKKFEESQFDGIVLPVIVEDGRGDSFRILKQKKFDGNFTSTGIFLADFLRKTNLQDKQVFLSVIDLFTVSSEESKLSAEMKSYEILRKALTEIYGLIPNIVINNNLYNPVIAREEYFSGLKEEFPNIDYAYTMFNRWDNIAEYQNIVPINVNIYDIISYINLGKKVYLPQFETKVFARQFCFEELLEYYKPEEEARLGFSFNDTADITVIAKENANKVLKKYLENHQ